MKKLVRITTIPLSMEKLLEGQIAYMSNHFEVITVSSDKERLEQLSNELGVRSHHIRLTRQITPLKDLKALWRLSWFLIKERPDIVHTHTPKAGFIGMLASWIVGVPVRMHTVAGLPLMESRGLKRRVLAGVERLTYAAATKVYPNSNNLRAFIANVKFTHLDKLKVFGNGSSNGINTESFKRTEENLKHSKLIASRLGIFPDDFVFIFVGRLVKDKGIEELVTAFEKLSKKYDNVKLLLVGPEEPELDPLSNDCRKIVNQNASIITVGYQQDVKPYLAMSQVLAFPSYREGFPNVPMQAGCYDLPCIVTNINGCNEIIIDGENGIIVPTKDSSKLFQAMEQLFLDKKLYLEMSEKARHMIVDRYDQEKIWQLILEEYKEQLNRKR